MELHIEKVKRIKAVSIRPNGNVNVIGGQNGNGKSSTLDSIAMLLGGKSLIPEKPVREGEQTASISADVGAYKVTRWWTNPTTSYLKVQAKDGSEVSSPQKVLTDLIGGNLSFDPLAFSTYEDKERLRILKEIAKVDFTALDKEYQEKFTERTVVKREGESTKTLLESFKDLSEVPSEPMDFEALKKEREDITNFNKQIEEELRAHRNKEDGIERLKGKIVSQKETLTRLNSELEALKSKIASEEEECRKCESLLKDEIAAHQELKGKENLLVPKSFDAVDAKIAQYHAQEANKARVKQKADLDLKLQEARAKYQTLDARLKEIDAEKVRMVTEAKLPITGLSLGEKDVLFNGIPFAQLSSSEQIRTSMAIAMALNPKFKVILIRNGSLLDSKAMAELNQIAIDHDFQVWVEKVMDGPDGNCIYIEDGMVLSAPLNEDTPL